MTTLEEQLADAHQQVRVMLLDSPWESAGHCLILTLDTAARDPLANLEPLAAAGKNTGTCPDPLGKTEQQGLHQGQVTRLSLLS